MKIHKQFDFDDIKRQTLMQQYFYNIPSDLYARIVTRIRPKEYNLLTMSRKELQNVC